MEAAIKPWLCRRCGKRLAVLGGQPPRPIFDAAMLPSSIRDHAAFVVVECPQCGEMQRWHKRGIIQEENIHEDDSRVTR